MDADKRWAEKADSPVVFIQKVEMVRVRSIRADGWLIDDYFDESGTRIGHTEWDGAAAGNSGAQSLEAA